jgi:hypothetical protein
VRAIAEVSDAVSKGDLTRSITVEASGEVAALKDDTNQMIRNLVQAKKWKPSAGSPGATTSKIARLSSKWPAKSRPRSPTALRRRTRATDSTGATRIAVAADERRRYSSGPPQTPRWSMQWRTLMCVSDSPMYFRKKTSGGRAPVKMTLKRRASRAAYMRKKQCRNDLFGQAKGPQNGSHAGQTQLLQEGPYVQSRADQEEQELEQDRGVFRGVPIADEALDFFV